MQARSNNRATVSRISSGEPEALLLASKRDDGKPARIAAACSTDVLPDDFGQDRDVAFVPRDAAPSPLHAALEFEGGSSRRIGGTSKRYATAIRPARGNFPGVAGGTPIFALRQRCAFALA